MYQNNHIVQRVGRFGIHLHVTSERYIAADAADDARRYLELFKQIEEPVVGISDFSVMRALDPGVRSLWGDVMVNHGRQYKVLHALLPEGAIGKIVGMAVSAWGLFVGVPIRCHGNRKAWSAAAAADGVRVPESEAA